MMTRFSKPLFCLFLSLLGILLSCKKSGGDPEPGATVNLVVGNPSVIGLSGATVVKDTDGNIFTIKVPTGTNVKSLKIAIPIKTGATMTPDPAVARDYTNPVQYVITGADGVKQTVTVKVEVEQGNKSAAKEITGFSFAGLSPVVTATIDQATRKITASVPSGTDMTKLVPTIVISNKATVSPASGTMQNFTNPVNFTVKAEDGSAQVYEVKVEKQTGIGSNKACLLTEINVEWDETKHIVYLGTVHMSFQYYPDGKVSEITSRRGYDSDMTFSSFEYNANGELIAWKPFYYGYDAGFRFVYDGGKAMKVQPYSGAQIGSALSITDVFGWELNDKNEVVKKSPSTYVYVNGNVTEFTDRYYKYKVEYDTKSSILSASDPKGLSSFVYWISSPSGVGFLPSFVNNATKITRVSDGSVREICEHTYNASGFPTKTVRKITSDSGDIDTFTYTYIYSNCP